MMYGYNNVDFNSMMGINNNSIGFGIWGLILYLIVITDLILLGVWLWKKINEKK